MLHLQITYLAKTQIDFECSPVSKKSLVMNKYAKITPTVILSPMKPSLNSVSKALKDTKKDSLKQWNWTGSTKS